MYDILLLNCRLLRPDAQPETDVVDIAIASGKIVEIAPYIAASAKLKIDVKQKLVSPPFVESHIHLDSALTAGQPRWNQSGTLFEGIDIWRDRKQDLDLQDVKTRAIATLKQQAIQGVLFVRSHVDVSEPNLTALQALLEVREEVKDWMTLQLVAFPQDGIYGSADNETLLEKALKLGADAVGGIPHYEFTREDGVHSVHRIFELAEQYDRLVDIHCDEIDDDQSRFLEVIAAYALRSGMGSRITASHTTAFGSYNAAYAQKLLGLLERSQINFVANPLINITLQGRTDTYPKRRGLTRVKELWQAGMNVSLGHDCIQDCWYPLGTGSMLDVASMLVHVSQMTGMAEINACYDMATWNGAKTLNVQDSYGIDVGKPANLIVLDASDRFDALRRRATVLYAIAQGQLIARTEAPKSQWQPILEDLLDTAPGGTTDQESSTARDLAQPASTDTDIDVDNDRESAQVPNSSLEVADEIDTGVEVSDEPISEGDIEDAIEEDPTVDTVDVVDELEADDEPTDQFKKSSADKDNSHFTLVKLADDPVERALTRLDEIEVKATNSSDRNGIASDYSLDDLSDEMPDEEVNTPDPLDLSDATDATDATDAATIYSIEQLVNELFSKEA